MEKYFISRIRIWLPILMLSLSISTFGQNSPKVDAELKVILKEMINLLYGSINGIPNQGNEKVQAKRQELINRLGSMNLKEYEKKYPCYFEVIEFIKACKSNEYNNKKKEEVTTAFLCSAFKHYRLIDEENYPPDAKAIKLDYTTRLGFDAGIFKSQLFKSPCAEYARINEKTCLGEAEIRITETPATEKEGKSDVEIISPLLIKINAPVPNIVTKDKETTLKFSVINAVSGNFSVYINDMMAFNGKVTDEEIVKKITLIDGKNSIKVRVTLKNAELEDSILVYYNANKVINPVVKTELEKLKERLDSQNGYTDGYLDIKKIAPNDYFDIPSNAKGNVYLVSLQDFISRQTIYFKGEKYTIDDNERHFKDYSEGMNNFYKVVNILENQGKGAYNIFLQGMADGTEFQAKRLETKYNSIDFTNIEVITLDNLRNPIYQKITVNGFYDNYKLPDLRGSFVRYIFKNHPKFELNSKIKLLKGRVIGPRETAIIENRNCVVAIVIDWEQALK